MKKNITIALSGNPNSGKTTLFNAVTGARQHIANYPGVTVEKKTGRINYKGYQINIVDLPGTYSLTAYSLEEIVARDFLVEEKPDLVVDIVDASNLDRNLYLAVQFKELGIPIIIALNMVDVAESRGIVIDYDELSILTGMPVVPMVARAKKGINELLDEVIKVAEEVGEWQPELISYGIDIDQGISMIEDQIGKLGANEVKYPVRWLALKCIEGDAEIKKYIEKHNMAAEAIDSICRQTFKHIKSTLEDDPEGIIADHRYGFITGITKKTVTRKIESRLNASDKADKILTNRVIGPVLMLLILYGIYKFTFWASEVPVVWFETLFKWIKNILSIVIPEGNLHSMIVSGVIDGVGGIFSFIPLIMFMFTAISIMEDSGYMARIAYMLDRILRWFGLHGNSVMALIISGGITGGCAVPGVMATRTLRDPKERIATLLVSPFMNCGAKLPIFAVIIAAFFPDDEARMMFLFTMLSWFFALFAAKIIRSTVLRGPKTPFVMELPPYRAPTLKGALIHTWERSWQYIRKAGTIILGISILLWAMMTYPKPNEEMTRYYELEREKNRTSFLSLPQVSERLKNEQDLDELEGLVAYYQGILQKEKGDIGTGRGYPLSPVAETVLSIRNPEEAGNAISEEHHSLASSYIDYKKRQALLLAEEQQEKLKVTIAGRIGKALEVVSVYIGFDYRTNVALAGGFIAKEVIVSTLGTAYSLGESETGDESPLADRLKRDPNWNPLTAFTLILFTILYVPCFVTVISIARESSWSWAGFSIIFNLIVAYFVCFVVYQTGMLLGVGV